MARIETAALMEDTISSVNQIIGLIGESAVDVDKRMLIYSRLAATEESDEYCSQTKD
jgi:hypothetical protein